VLELFNRTIIFSSLSVKEFEHASSGLSIAEFRSHRDSRCALRPFDNHAGSGENC